MFFCVIRQRGGFNNKPSPLQFQNAYRRLLGQHQIKARNGNCMPMDATQLLYVGSGTRIAIKDSLIDDINSIIIAEGDHNYCYNDVNLSLYKEHVIGNIAGFVVKQIIKKIKCSICEGLLTTEHSNSALLNLKKWGKLVIPSKEVIEICKLLEVLIKENNAVYKKGQIADHLILQLFRKNIDKIFSNKVMQDHILGQDLLDNHRIQLIRIIGTVYLKVRLHHEAKVKNCWNKSNRIRHKYTKLILFNKE
ncbi:hypothetical protein ILUMI_14433 [Ignelater luminosus]|uniref:Transposable element P transposase-like RNase H C-terminal domain-containing protein n=1 Tax=Ignelater luminosus TaxID=2038154 RepID=A0A8K0CQH5_IGNLU|nr:hypothetical protein ILUMI_14433 [Ignelater luminosus]